MSTTPTTPPPPTPAAAASIPGAEKKIAAGICGILLGALGIHKFILGYKKEALIMLLVSVISLGFLAWIMGIIGLIEGIIYLTKTDQDFVNTYVTGKKGWFLSAFPPAARWSPPPLPTPFRLMCGAAFVFGTGGRVS
nr:TM2 domain-containing protein [Geminisphaera colitermitum]